MRAQVLLVSMALLLNCYGNPAPPEPVPSTPHFVLGTSSRRVTVELPQAAFVTVFAFSELGANTLLAPVTPIGRLSFGPLPPGRSDVSLTRAIPYAVQQTSAFVGGNPVSPEPASRTAVWSLDDWPVLVVVASAKPLDPVAIRRAVPVVDPQARYDRPAADRRAGRLATAARFLILLQEGQPLLARAVIEHRVH
jgi:hypothetical protein